MNDPVILKFPAPEGEPATVDSTASGRRQPPGRPEVPGDSRPPLAGMADADLQTILQAWNEATDRLQHTHETLRAEVSRLSDELEAKNLELARKNRLADLGQMASHVAHEVRNSLVPMKLYLSLLRRRTDYDAGSVSVLDKIMAGFTALEATVSDLLHFSSQRDARRERINVASLLHDVVQSLEPQFDAQDIWAKVDCQPGLTAMVDPDMLKRAVLNLVLNALDALPTGGDLAITACQTSTGLEIEIADSGPGVPAAIVDRLFEPFFTTKGSGTGLGLAIVERIAAAHGGRAKVVNCPEGGAAFTLIIPQHSQAMERAA
ncbi:MAG TPA: ATP-binding protein [Pirellulaceae bacterium]